MNLSFNSYFVSLGEAYRNDYEIYIQMVNKNVAIVRFGFLINPKEDEEEIKILKIINDFNYNSVFLKAFYKNDNNTIIVVGFMDYLTNKDDLLIWLNRMIDYIEEEEIKASVASLYSLKGE